MSRTFYLAETRAQVERFLERKLNPTSETHVLNPEQIAGFGKVSTIVFMDGWEHSVKDPLRFEQEAMLRQFAGAIIIDAPWDRRSQPQQQWGKSVPQMWARQAGKRLAQEDHVVDAFRYYMHSLREPKLTRWQKTKRTVSRWFRDRRVALAEWIAGDDWPAAW